MLIFNKSGQTAAEGSSKQKRRIRGVYCFKRIQLEEEEEEEEEKEEKEEEREDNYDSMSTKKEK